MTLLLFQHTKSDAMTIWATKSTQIILNRFIFPTPFYPNLAPFSCRKRYKFLQWQEQEIKTVSTTDRDPLIFITNVLDHLASKSLKSIP